MKNETKFNTMQLDHKEQVLPNLNDYTHKYCLLRNSILSNKGYFLPDLDDKAGANKGLIYDYDLPESSNCVIL